MPTYDYQCRGCGHQFEELQSFSEPALTKCPACKKNKLERLFGGGGAIIFKGTGFYETDYRRAADAKADKKDGKDGKGDSDAAPATDGKSDGAAESKPDPKADAKPASGSDAAPASPPPAASPAKSEGKGGKKTAK